MPSSARSTMSQLRSRAVTIPSVMGMFSLLDCLVHDFCLRAFGQFYLKGGQNLAYQEVVTD